MRSGTIEYRLKTSQSLSSFHSGTFTSRGTGEGKQERGKIPRLREIYRRGARFQDFGGAVGRRFQGAVAVVVIVRKGACEKVGNRRGFLLQVLGSVFEDEKGYFTPGFRNAPNSDDVAQPKIVGL